MTRHASPPWFPFDSRFAYFRTAAFVVGLLRLDQKIVTRRADVIESRGERARHRHRVVSGILRSPFDVWRSDAIAVRGRAGGRGAGILRAHHLSREDWRASTNCSSRRRSDAIASNLTRSRQIKSGNRYRSYHRCRSSQKPASSQSFTDLGIPNESQFPAVDIRPRLSLPVFPDEQTFSQSICMSQRCQNLTHALQRIAH
jgi:hypothetical protein